MGWLILLTILAIAGWLWGWLGLVIVLLLCIIARLGIVVTLYRVMIAAFKAGYRGDKRD